ncbi:photosynthetic NDH subunit of subcomplex B 5, chloroplastic [Ziziphus jujuba]|uniref:Photosynthetic NDH subunit of subcomplex B 5, chloroplastic n=1 Tax=Ziziphus jujuba TaxID=326968 RepID=A0A6P3YYT8_ZIZJJ|nr:photosynthetic NDH subunit of subcomplex B 5, chloroplastic [Ziziphus jujuba]
MAVCCSSPSIFSTHSVPKISSSNSLEPRITVSNRRSLDFGKRTWKRLKAAGLSEIEPDLNEDPVDRWATNSVSPEDFVYGKYDEHHTYNEAEDKGPFWETLVEEFQSVEPPTGFQGLISWLFPPAIAAGYYFHVPGEYLFIGAGLFTIVFCIIEMDKPDQPHNFEPQIYNMERGARDKLIADYNTMDIWDFNEKYGDLWDFTVKKDDITKR